MSKTFFSFMCACALIATAGTAGAETVLKRRIVSYWLKADVKICSHAEMAAGCEDSFVPDFKSSRDCRFRQPLRPFGHAAKQAYAALTAGIRETGGEMRLELEAFQGTNYCDSPNAFWHFTSVDAIFVEYEAGHGDLAFEFNVVDGELEALIEAEGATIDGVPNVTGEFDISRVKITTNATFARPAVDGGAFAPLCVEPGQTVGWLPQGNRDASDNNVPFVGIAAEVPAGVFVEDKLTLELTSVVSPTGLGSYSIWKDGFPPSFKMSSCNGIDPEDSMDLAIGHDHYNMGFADAVPGLWAVTYRVSGQLVADGSRSELTFTVHYEIK